MTILTKAYDSVSRFEPRGAVFLPLFGNSEPLETL